MSIKGAVGLLQLMPATARELGVKQIGNPEESLDGGARYLKILLARYNNDPQLALAAYNAGPSRVDQHRGVPPFRETQTYVTSISRGLRRD